MKKFPLLAISVLSALPLVAAIACDNDKKPKTDTPTEYYSTNNAHQQGSYPNNQGDSVGKDSEYRPVNSGKEFDDNEGR